MFKLDEFMGKRVLTSSELEDEEICAFFTTRELSLKAGEREDLINEVEENKKLICEGFDIPLENLVIPIQTHSSNIAVIKSQGMQDGSMAGDSNLPSCPLALLPSNLENTDALITNQRGIALALNFADCVPIIFYDPIKKVIALAHAGWRGTVEQIAPKTVSKMIEEFGCNPTDIVAAIGPSIGKCCFEVKEDVMKLILDSIDNQACEAICDNYIDLKLVNKIQLLASGVKKIDLSEYCTSCQSELFFSYRKENGKTARHSAVIILK